jgi:hypothetical protein
VRHALEQEGVSSEDDDEEPASSRARPAQPIFQENPKEAFARLGFLVFKAFQEVTKLVEQDKKTKK